MNMEGRTRRRGGSTTEDRGRMTSGTRKGRRSVDIRRHWFEVVNRDGVLAVAEL